MTDHLGNMLGRNSVFAVTNACAGCGACIRTCPEKAFLPGRTGGRVPLVILEDRCSGCAECAEVCPVAAIVEVKGRESGNASLRESEVGKKRGAAPEYGAGGSA